MDAKTLLNHATRTARAMSKDPEVESIAGEAVVWAMRTYDPSKGLTALQWASYVTRQHVWQYWRSRACRPLEVTSTLEPSCEDTTDADDTHPDFQLLVERYIDGVAEWSLARRAGVSTYAMHLRIEAAKARFLQFMGAL